LLACDGVSKSKVKCVQADALDRVGFGTVFFVACDRTVYISQMDANLIFASGLDADFEEAIEAKFPDGFIVSDSKLCAGLFLRDRRDLVITGFKKPAFDYAIFLIWTAFDEGVI
jgi:hypothetical protein